MNHYTSDHNAHNIPSYRALWRAVLLQSFTDIICNYSRTEDKLAHEYAKNFLTKPSPSLKKICSYAEFSMDFVINKAQYILENRDHYNTNMLRKLRLELISQEKQRSNYEQKQFNKDQCTSITTHYSNQTRARSPRYKPHQCIGKITGYTNKTYESRRKIPRA